MAGEFDPLAPVKKGSILTFCESLSHRRQALRSY
jgi:hypothetical protein